MNYSKRQMKPLIDKFAINPETNKLFIKICEMFDGQTNYQLWAVKMIFSMALPFTELEKIHDWISKNSNFICKLEKQNIVSYSNKTLVNRLLKEMNGIDRMNFIKGIVSHFNTEQKKILNDAIFDHEITPYEAATDKTIKKWYDMFKAFNKKPISIKNKFYSTCSALKNIDTLELAISDCLKESYVWEAGKEDLLAFVEHNASDCEVVFDQGNCVILEVPSFSSSKKLCGGGRTGWCISRESNFFSQYVTSYDNRKQYFLFDFNRKEADAFAHIGFTIEKGSGIVEAQTSHNHPMKNEKYTQGDESLNIYDVFKKFGINMNIFMQIRRLSFGWDIQEVLNMVKREPQNYAVAYEKDNRLVLKVLNSSSLNKITESTYVNKNSFYPINDENSIYVLIDFNKELVDEMSMVVFGVTNDTYGCPSLYAWQTIYGNVPNKNSLSDELKKNGMSFDDFIGQEKLDPSILLHKYIDEGNENAAIKLIEKERGNIDINYQFNYKIPVLSAVSHRMYRLFDTIVNCEEFNGKIENGFGETLLGSLLYVYGNENIALTDSDNEAMETMIKSIISSKNYDFNSKDGNNDTPINYVCEVPKEFWVLKALASMKEVDVNTVNDFGFSPIATCLQNNNMKALEVIGQRPDLKVRDKDKRMAKELGINLKDYIKPTETIFGKYKVENELSPKKELTLEPIEIEVKFSEPFF